MPDNGILSTGIIGLVLLIVLIVIGPILAVPLILYLSVKGMVGSESTFQNATPQEFPDDYQVATQTDQWARAKGFRFLGAYSMKLPNTVFIAAWQLGQSATFFCMYGVHNKYAYDFVTILAPNRTLITTNTRDGLMMPRPPGRYCQAFENTDFDTMWARHQEALGYLQTAGGIAAQPSNKTFQEIFTGFHAESLRYVQSIPFWPLRGLKWYFISRAKLSNKSIEEQHRAGLTQLPTDLARRE